jgi:hypothetical protein
MTIKVSERQLYMGQGTKQVKGILKRFEKFFRKQEFKNIIEIGSGNGVFSTYIASKAKEMGSSFITYDLKPVSTQIRNHLESLGFTVVTDDVNKHIDEIVEIIKKPERCLVMIDGADKSGPFLYFIKFLKENDIILSHDYYKEEDDNIRRIVGIHMEYVDLNGVDVDIIYKDLFDNYLWLCCIKRGNNENTIASS